MRALPEMLIGIFTLHAIVAARAEVAPAGPELQISSDTLIIAEAFPSVAAFPNGDFVVTWSENINFVFEGSSRAEVMARRFASSGEPLGSELQVNTYTTGGQGFPIVDAWDGGFVIVWESDPRLANPQPPNAEPEFASFRSYDTAGMPLSDETRFSEPGSEAMASADADGKFIALAFGFNSGTRSLVGGRFDSGGAPLGGTIAVSSTGTRLYPALAALSGGSFVLVKDKICCFGSASTVELQQFAPDGTPLGESLRLNRYPECRATFPSIAKDPRGGFVVAWMTQTRTGPRLVVQRFSADGSTVGDQIFASGAATTLGPRYLLNSARLVATGPDGSFLTVWETEDGSGTGIAARQFDSVGSPIGGEFLVNTSTTNHQTRPSVSADGNGNFVVVWDDSTVDDFRGVIRGRILQPRLVSGVSEPTPTTTERIETPSPNPYPHCPGDCDNDYRVDISELVANVHILFGQAPPCICDWFGVEDEQFSVVELLGAVGSALDGCPPRP